MNERTSFLKNAPDIFKRKMLVDVFIEKEKSKGIVSFADFKRLKRMQQQLREMCVNYMRKK